MTSSEELHDMSIEQLGQLFPIVLQDYSAHWIHLFHEESKLIRQSFPPMHILGIDHIGSTAIPGLKAKPCIDMLLQVSQHTDLLKMKEIFKSLDYLINEHPENPPPHLTFVKGYSKEGFKGQAYHVHVRYKGDWDEIVFRDYLIDHVEIASQYEALKMELAVKYRNNREAYTDAKTEFISEVHERMRKQSTRS